MRYILDADVLIGALDSRDVHHRAARRAFTSWRAGRDPLSMSAINVTEVLIAAAADRERLRAARAAIAALGVEIHSPNEAIAVDAARLRSAHPISLADAYLLATARHLSATAASFDQKVLRAAAAEAILAASG